MEHSRISQILKSLGSVKSQNPHTSVWIYSTAAAAVVVEVVVVE